MGEIHSWIQVTFPVSSQTMTQPIKIYHNPKCGTSRKTLALLQESGQDVEVIEYLETPPSRDTLVELINKAGISVRDALKTNVELYKTLKLEDSHWSDEELISFIMEHPILMNRPFVVTKKGVRLCRPCEVVLEIL